MPTKLEVERTFHIYNATLFGNRLYLPRIQVRSMKTDLARWYEPEPEFAQGLLILNKTKRHPWGWRSSLLHEMIHISVPWPEADHHGPLFTAEANRVGRLMGLEECEVHEAWNWPMHHLSHTFETLDGSPPDIMDDH